MPPVVMNFSLGKGPPRSLSIFTPPLVSAGKNLSVSSPRERPISISLGVHTPGQQGTSCSLHHLTVSGLSPADTMNWAPALTAFSAREGLMTVPAPTTISGQASLMRLMASSAASVRNVISAVLIPPLIMAFARGTAFAASSILTTGTIARSWKNLKSSVLVMFHSFFV